MTRLLERVAQTHFVSGSTYDTDDSVSHGSEEMSHGGNENSDARSHDQNLASARNSFEGFQVRILIVVRRALTRWTKTDVRTNRIINNK